MKSKTSRKIISFPGQSFLLPLRSLVALGLVLAVSMGNVSPCLAKDVYPAEKITFIVPHRVGGGYDIFARGIAPYISKYLKRIPGAKGGDIVVRNEPAAAGRKGYSLLFNAKPDGYTIGVTDTAPITDSIIDKPEFDFTKLTFLALGSSGTQYMVANKNGFKSWNEVVNAMTKGPVKLAVGSFGRYYHVSGIVFNERMKTNFKLINFQGTTGSIGAVLRGDVQLASVAEDSAEALLAAKEVNVVFTCTEVNRFPGATTIAEFGFPELTELVSYHRFIIGPPGLKGAEKEALITAIKKAIADPGYIAWAKEAKFNLRNIYGDDAKKSYNDFSKFYLNLAPVLIKQLNK